MDDAPITVSITGSLDDIDAAEWDGLQHGPAPFLRYGFLRALVDSASIGPGTGWVPVFIRCYAGDAIIGAAVAYLKDHSYGEYIFDWQWASACERMGMPYYPKIVFAVPATPASGQRILLADDSYRDTVVAALRQVAHTLAEDIDASSIHWLFVTKEEHDALAEVGFAKRASYQFHWRNDNYQTFDDFLARLTSRKRKQIRKERRAAEVGVDAIERVRGADVDKATLDAMDVFYRDTVFAHGGHDYLRPGFFHAVCASLPDNTMIVRAIKDDEIIAGAIFFLGDKTLFGRYWGCREDVKFLHFELAYYQGIEFCIEHDFELFEAGAQGGHKLLRGFMPQPTYSNHWIADPQLGAAIRSFLRREADEVEHAMEALAARGPYKVDE